MIGFWKRLRDSERGQALIIVLALLAIGGLTIAVSLNYATTNLKGSRIVEEKMDGVYAAGAGVEYVLWALKQGWSVPEGGTTSNVTPENINQMAVGIETQNKGTRTLILTGWSPLSPGQTHPDYVGISKAVTWNGTAQAYNYTVTLTWNVQSGSPVVRVEELGIRIPAGFSYKSSPAPSGMSTSAPAIDGGIFTWSWSGSGRPTLAQNPGTLTQTFYITGSGDTGGSYAWIETGRADIGTVGEMTGTLYKITATAERPEGGRTMAEILVDMLMMGGTPYIVSWQITN